MEEISLTVDNNFVGIFWALWLIRKSHTWSNQSEQTCFFSSQSGVEATTKRDMAYVFRVLDTGCKFFCASSTSCNFSRALDPVACFPALGIRCMLFRFLIGSLHYLRWLWLARCDFLGSGLWQSCECFSICIRTLRLFFLQSSCNR